MADFEITVTDATPFEVTIEGGVAPGYVAADTPLYLNGSGGDTYFLYDSATSTLQLWVNGSQVGEWT